MVFLAFLITAEVQMTQRKIIMIKKTWYLFGHSRAGGNP
jgi:hypothetical protein